MMTQYEKHLKGRHFYNLNKSKILREKYSMNPKFCKNCSKAIDFNLKKNNFCNHSCSASFNNKKRIERGFTIKGKLKKKTCIKCNIEFEVLAGSSKKVCSLCSIPEQVLYDLECSICNKKFKNRIKRKTCGKECREKAYIYAGSKGGKKSVTVQKRRSKNEIYFYELCKDRFINVDHNVSMFNGWDADVIVHDNKIAVLWNGVWHYKKVTESHSLDQVRNRDKIKLLEIKKCGFIPYVIKDMGIYNKQFVEEQFNLFLETLL